MPGFQGYSIDDSIDRIGSGSAHLPEGTYLWEVLSVKPSPDREGIPYHTLKVIARDGIREGIGLTVNKTMTMKEDTHWVLGSICKATGVDTKKVRQLSGQVTTYKKHAAFSLALNNLLAGKMFAAAVQDNDYTSQAGNSGTNSELVMATVLPANSFKAAPGGAVAAGKSKKAEPDEDEEEDLETRFKNVIGDEDDEDDEDEDDEDEDDEDDDEDDEDEEDEEEEEPPARRGAPTQPARRAAPARRPAR